MLSQNVSNTNVVTQYVGQKHIVGEEKDLEKLRVGSHERNALQ